MVRGVASTAVNSTVHLSNIIRAQYANGRIALPVHGNLYTRFKHVQGVPASTSNGGYSVSKLRMIDLLVDRLVKLKGHSVMKLTEDQTGDHDTLISQFAGELSRSLRSADAISPSVTAGIAERGMLVNLVA